MSVFQSPPLVVGHRGAGELAVSGLTENSIDGCLAGHADGAAWVEVDAQLTRDGQVVLHHDAHLPDGRAIDEASLEACRAQGLVTLDELLAAMPDGLGVDLEIKAALGDARTTDADSTAGVVARRAAELLGTRPVLLTSFNPAALLQAARVAPEVPRGVLGMPITPLRELVPAAVHLDARVVAAHAVSLGAVRAGGLPVDSDERIREAVAVAHDLGLEVLVWGVAPSHVPALVEVGVDAMCVDEVRACVEAVAGATGAETVGREDAGTTAPRATGR